MLPEARNGNWFLTLNTMLMGSVDKAIFRGDIQPRSKLA